MWLKVYFQEKHMFAVIYRAYIKLDKEDEYQNSWRIVADYFINHRSALGSCLHKSDDGMWIAYSRWPDKETRDNAWPQDESVNSGFPNEIKDAILGMKSCFIEEGTLPEICMTVIDDLL